jgi:hypothetical protein
MVSPRAALSPLIESRLASPLRSIMAGHRGRLDGQGTVEAARARHAKLLRPEDLTVPAERDRSADLFILGSGPSVLELRTSDFEQIRGGTSIGLNSWVLHEFVPHAYGFEEMENDDYVSVASTISKVLIEPRIAGARPLILHLRPKPDTPSRRLVRIPPSLTQNLRYYGRTTVECRNIRNLEDDLTSLIRMKRQREIPDHVLLDSGSSVARIASLGIVRGFSRIVLIGVDLNTSDYFFDRDRRFLSARGLSTFNPSVQRSDRHDTEETFNRPFSSSEFLSALANASLRAGGPQIYVGSASSKLAADLPVFPW